MKQVLSYMFTALAVITVISTGCKKEDPIAVTGVTLSEPTLTLTEGDQATLEATVVPADAANLNVTWSSSNESVATVADGVVTAIAEGQATITVTTVDGKKTATCAVTVNKVVIVPYITAITTKEGDFDYWIAGSGEATIDWGDGSEVQTITLKPLTKGDILYLWNREDHSFPHSYAAAGAKTVTITGADITGFYSHYSGGITMLDVTHVPGLLSLDCNSEQLTALDISGNPALHDLYCFYNGIEEFTIGEHPDLTIIGCDTNNMSRATLVNIFNALPMRAPEDGATMWCGYNPGFEELTAADYEIANDKNWGVYAE